MVSHLVNSQWTNLEVGQPPFEWQGDVEIMIPEGWQPQEVKMLDEPLLLPYPAARSSQRRNN